jgi:hypothetical protein
MFSESARVTTRAESRFRVPYPNSKQRAVKVIALDAASATLVDNLSKLTWNGAQFFTATPDGPARAGEGAIKAWLNDLTGHTLDLVEEVANSDFVVVITSAGEDAHAASVISEICQMHHKTLIALVVPTSDENEAAVAESLKHLRPYARMLVVTHGPDYVETMLTALRA